MWPLPVTEDTIFDAWLGIDMGIGQKVAILRFRGFWEADCVPSKAGDFPKDFPGISRGLGGSALFGLKWQP